MDGMNQPKGSEQQPASAIPYRALLAALLVAFCLRIVAQGVVTVLPAVPLLPATSQWQGGTLPYGVLLAVQIGVAACMTLALLTVGSLGVRPVVSRMLRVLGWSSVLVLSARLVIGALGLVEHPWFDGALPTAFHFVVTAFVLIFAYAIASPADPRTPRLNWSRFVAYPALICGSYMLFVWLRDTGCPLLFASYLAVMLGTLGVVLHESFNPAREDWRPDQDDILADGVFLVVVQVGLPAVLKALGPAAIIALAGSALFSNLQLWPYAWPLLAQIALMLVAAEFFRYWLHRMMHEFTPLWRLHAVHHASDKLYTVNVGRFHPLDKAIQFFGDSLPFLLLGVGPEVFAAYFVVYAVNGFYQHSNADIRLGPLNWIVAGPELHRWHHSTVVQEGHANYGNNLIIWDAVFGTRLLPPDRTVEDVGIGNKKWPRGFFAQVLAPVTQPTEHDP